MIEKIIAVGKTIDPLFEIIEEQKQYYIDLVRYFSNHAGTLDVNKGLLISGDIGTGKTLSMKVMQKMFGNIKIVSARHLIREFLMSKVNGMDVLDEYGRRSFYKTPQGQIDIKRPMQIYFDDLGLEEVNTKMYGNQQNILAEILLDRYENFKHHGMKTYATTNLTPDAMEKIYGLRVRDRMVEMMNYVTLTGKSKRK